ncbi:Spy/CpxP family protein refolding chaperone [Thalassotalea sp. ND16A]|uniref:Spy/CpxP family protein refolding chaperone n=1 Tax=Thalassotalea sp. ND16A TaxID=1535422 RepID=UPI00051DC8CC|nr:Spy/CpxP family protein refolding chaperone [Thalassotalea sp. ND16A]KGJ98148.1 hypothetical protein ND16A_0953 [Thalassotalea sp. ND16A]
MNKQIKNIALLCTTLVALTLGTSVMAKEHGKSHRGQDMQRHMRAMMSKLDLSEQQQQQVKAIQAAKKEQLMALKSSDDGKDKNGRSAMAELIKAETFDETAFILMQEKKAAKMAKAGLITAKTMHQLYQLLTPEQKQKLEQMQQQKRERKQGNKQKHRDAKVSKTEQ